MAGDTQQVSYLSAIFPAVKVNKEVELDSPAVLKVQKKSDDFH